MRTTTKRNILLSAAPAWMLIGITLVLTAILAFVTIQDIRRQHAADRTLLLEKGAALIRAFEAGTRSGMAMTQWGRRHLKRLLIETAKQPDIAYLMVTDLQGQVLAHSDPDLIGSLHGQNLDLARVADTTGEIFRITSGTEEQTVFEVYRRFTPTRPHRPKHRGPGRGRGPKGWLPPDKNERGQPPPVMEAIIFVGLDMTAINQTRTTAARRSVIMATILLVAGMGGFYLIMVLQSFRSTKISFERLQSFSSQLIEQLPMGLVALDPALKPLTVNPQARQILKLNPSPGKSLPTHTALPVELQAILKTLENSDTAIEREIDCQIENDTPTPLGVGATAWHDDNQKLLGYILLVRDLTEIHVLRKEIARSQRLAALGNLAAGVAHEIRNPLSSIKGFATYFKERYPDNSADQQTAAIMIQEVDRLDRVVSQLLELARPVTIPNETVDITEIVSSTLDLIQPELETHQIALTVEQAADLPWLAIDTDRIRQVLLNLLLNAIEAMQPGGSLKLTTAHRPSEGLEIQIQDSGSGIDPSDQAHIFDPYFTTKSTGTGLGLAIVHHIIEAHRGRISVDSIPGEGTTFTLLFPLSQDSRHAS